MLPPGEWQSALTSTEPPSLSAGVKLVPSSSVDCLISAHAEPLCVASYAQLTDELFSKLQQIARKTYNYEKVVNNHIAIQ